ncbi:MAG: carboxylesterase family protein [Candidatus Binataceae bacterium]
MPRCVGSQPTSPDSAATPNASPSIGVSAGGASISLLLTSAVGKGLFQRAILESPGSLRPLASLSEAEEAGLMLGNDLAAMRAMPGSIGYD